MPNELSISCNWHDFKEMDLSVHLVNGAVQIIIIKCDNCESAYTLTPNTVQNA
jgi:hypothetical protein